MFLFLLGGGGIGFQPVVTGLDWMASRFGWVLLAFRCAEPDFQINLIEFERVLYWRL